MSKLYNVIHLNGEQYAVDKIPNAPYIGPYILSWPNGTKELFNSHNSIADSRRELSVKVVATSDKKLGLPLLPPIEEDIKELARNFAMRNTGSRPDYRVVEAMEDGYIGGYKAASQKNERLVMLLKSCLTVESIKGKLLENMIKDELQSLSPKPKKVWIYEEDGIPLIENGYVRVERWEY